MRTATPILLLHGLDGSPSGRKAAALRESGLDLICPNAKGLNLRARIEQVKPIIEQLDTAVVVGSSYGGLVGIWVAQHYPKIVKGLILCAPALHRLEPPLFSNFRVPSDVQGHVIHGIHDEVVPLSVSENFIQEHPRFRLERVDDDHSLRHSLQKLTAAVDDFANSTV